MKEPMVSIIIATYNSGKTIRRALESVESQTFQDWECLIVDGASKDDTIEIVKEFVAKDTRFRYISEPDNGIYDAFNKGWRNAKGEWIQYLGSDDFLTKEGIENLVKYCDPDIEIISGDVLINHLDGGTSLVEAGDGKPILGNHQGMLMRRDVIMQYGGFDQKYKILADFDLMVRILLSGGKIRPVHEMPIAYFSQGGTTTRFEYMKKYIQERCEISKKFGREKHPTLKTYNIIYRKIQSNIYRSIRKKLGF